MNEKFTVCVVVLQYNNADITKKCVDSLLAIDPDHSYSILIVDNASVDDSVEDITLCYKDEKNVRIVSLEENLGYAKGNNRGYQIAKKEYCPDCIIVSNNDVIFDNTWRYKSLAEIIQKDAADIIAPSIININGESSNPLMEHPIEDPRKIRVKMAIRSMYIAMLVLKKRIGINDSFMLVEQIIGRARKHRVKSVYQERYGIVPHGACIVIMRNFIEAEDVLFDPRTFMYQEEIIFAYKAKKRGYRTLFCPLLKVRHLEGHSTNRAYMGTDRLLFRFSNEKKSFQVMLDVMKEM